MVIQYYPLSLDRHTIKNKKVECFESALVREIETSAFKLFMVANLQIRPCTTQNQMQFYCRT